MASALLSKDERTPLGKTIDEWTCEQREAHHRQELDRGDEAELGRRARNVQDEPGLADILHPCADDRDELPRPKYPEVALRQGRKIAIAKRWKDLWTYHAHTDPDNSSRMVVFGQCRDLRDRSGGGCREAISGKSKTLSRSRNGRRATVRGNVKDGACMPGLPKSWGALTHELGTC